MFDKGDFSNETQSVNTPSESLTGIESLFGAAKTFYSMVQSPTLLKYNEPAVIRFFQYTYMYMERVMIYVQICPDDLRT